MNDKPAPMRKQLLLSEEEALSLLDVCLFSETQDNPYMLQAMHRLIGLCREFLREPAAGKADAAAAQAAVVDALDRASDRWRSVSH